MIVVRWYWQHGGHYAERHDTLDDAFAAAYGDSETGAAATASFEILDDPDGTTTVLDRGDPRYRAYADAADQRETERYADLPPHTHGIKVRAPDGREAWWGSYTSEAEMLAAYTALPAALRGRAVTGTVPWRPYTPASLAG